MSNLPEVTGGPISDQQRTAIAMMTVGGAPISIIASAIRRPAATIRRLIKEDQYVRDQMREYESRYVSTYAFHKFEMMGKLARAREAIDSGLDAPDLKLRLDTAKWTIENVVPKDAQRIDVNMEFGGQVEISQALPLIVKSLKGLDEAGGSDDSFQRHVRKELPGGTDMDHTFEQPEPVTVEVEVEE